MASTPQTGPNNVPAQVGRADDFLLIWVNSGGEPAVVLPSVRSPTCRVGPYERSPLMHLPRRGKADGAQHKSCLNGVRVAQQTFPLRTNAFSLCLSLS